MAMSATISMSPSSAVTGQKVMAILTITNTSAFPVKILTVNPYAFRTSGSVAIYNSGVSFGPINIGPNSNVTVPANSGTLNLNFEVRFHGPSTMSASNEYDNTGAGTFSVGAVLTSDDGSSFAPTVTTISVNYAVELE